MIEEMLLGVGSQIVGPVARLDAAVQLAQAAPIDAAVLDINIQGGTPIPSRISWSSGESPSSSAAATAIGR